MMTITSDHWLTIAERQLLPGGNPMSTRRFLVVHFTGGWDAQGSLDFWKTPAAKGACAHILLDRDGTMIQCRPFNRTAGHAGVSKWRDPKTGVVYKGLNDCSIGIEVCNCGDLPRERYPLKLGGGPIPRISARHKNGGPVKRWEKYPDVQLAALDDVAAVLVRRYQLDDVVGHDDIAPERKNDPGPAFPMEAFRIKLGFPPLPRP